MDDKTLMSVCKKIDEALRLLANEVVQRRQRYLRQRANAMGYHVREKRGMIELRGKGIGISTSVAHKFKDYTAAKAWLDNSTEE